MITVPEEVFAAWFDRLTMTGHPELVEGWTPYAQIIAALCITIIREKSIISHFRVK